MLHVRWNPSARKRWLKCVASKVLPSDDMPSPASVRGTALHELADSLYGSPETRLDHLLGMAGDKLRTDDGLYTLTLEDVELISKWWKAVDDQIAIAREEAAKNGDVIDVSFERFGTYEMAEDMGGTADVLIKYPGVTVILDLKTGRMAVPVEGNAQLSVYADIHAEPGDRIILGIFQFGAMHLEEIDYETLRSRVAGDLLVREHGESLRLWMAETDPSAEEFVSHAGLAAGEHCDYCPATSSCPLMVLILERLKNIMTNIDTITEEDYIWLANNKRAINRLISTGERQAKREWEMTGNVPEGWQVRTEGLNETWKIADREAFSLLISEQTVPMEWMTLSQIAKKSPELFDMLRDSGIIERGKEELRKPTIEPVGG